MSASSSEPSTSRRTLCGRLLLASLLAQGCTGFIEQGSPAEPEPPPPIERPAAKPRFTCSTPERRGLAQTGLRRMANGELANTLSALLGPSANDPGIRAAIDGLPNDEVRYSAADFSASHPQDYAATLLRVAERTLTLLDASAAERVRVFGACAEVAPTDACANAFIRNFGGAVYRRPLTSEEAASYFDAFTAAGKGRRGFSAVLFVLLQSPPLAFHVEYGTEANPQRRRLSDFEIAGRIAYLATGAPPDGELLQAAAHPGQLQELVAVTAQVSRLLDGDSPAARQRLRSFFNFYGDLNVVDDPDQRVGDLHALTTAGLGEAMKQEAFDYFEHIFWTSGGGFAELMTSRVAFPRSEALVRILGTGPQLLPAGQPVIAPEFRLGLLHRPALLASSGPRTSPILRGAHLRVKYLCEPTPLPPNELIDAVLKDVGDIENQTNRARVLQLTSGAACKGCHSRINPLGFSFEGFDTLGFKRTEEVVVGAAIGPFRIDTRVDRPLIEPDEDPSLSLADSAELSRAIAGGTRGRACFVQKAFEFAHARSVVPDVDECGLAEAEAIVASGSLRDTFIRLISNDDIFWRKAAN